jgi:hypothetical protein
MLYRDSEEDEGQLKGPDGDIVNQMIIYLDYVGQCDLGIVLFADPNSSNDIMVVQGNRKIYFMNCFPYNENCDLALANIRKRIYNEAKAA